ncbi:hypothetical protein ALP76_04667 [Pseudomonas savastanoi pv. glycinea]|nr:hypothetical protein ALP76_04667 [Pseudomonas savastanoi pv. glycinea]
MQVVKSEAFSSPLNGGLMEKIFQLLCDLDDRTLPPPVDPLRHTLSPRWPRR